MKNTRDNRQTQVKNCLKWTASGLLLALMFVLVFAGTLSGAFGIESDLQQNGIIQSNVASAAFGHDGAGSPTTVNDSSNNVGDIVLWSSISCESAIMWSTTYTMWCSFTAGGTLQSIIKAGYCEMMLACNVTNECSRYTLNLMAGTGREKDDISGNESISLKLTSSSEVSTGWFDVTSTSFAVTIKYGGYVGDKSVVENVRIGFRIKQSALSALEGNGSIDNPYTLADRLDFDILSGYVASWSDCANKYFKIQPDTSITGQSNGKTIEMGSSAFTPIGYYGTSSTFKGNLDGNGCTIKGLKVDLSIARAGFIGALSGGSVKNLTIDSTSTIKSSASDAAGIVGYMTGGIVENCVNYATVSGGKQNGGVVANVNNDNAIIRNCKNYGAVSGTVLIGGIVGYLQKGTIQTCSNSGKTTATGNAITLNSLTGAYLGGIVGYANGNISNCYNEGEVTTGTSWGSSNIVGGIAGYVVSGKAVAYCYNKGAVSGSNDVGGIVGNLAGGISAVSYCYHDGKINGLWNDASANIGYIAGNQSGVFGTSWKLPGASISSGAYTPKENARVISFGTGVSYSPAVISGGIYSDKVWTDITNSNINGFKTTATVTNGKFLSSATASNGATSVVPAKIDGALTANANGASAQQTTDATLAYWYNANTSSNIYNIYVQIKDISGAADETTYNGTKQKINNVSASPFTATAFYFDANYAGTATDGKMNAGTYSVIVDVVANGNVVGRKLFGSWTIEKETLSIVPSWSTGMSNGASKVYNGAQQGLLSFTVSGFVENESVAGGHAAFNVTPTICTVANPSSGSIYTIGTSTNVSDNYRITIALANSQNYKMDLSVAYSWKITKRSVAIIDKSYFYGANIVTDPIFETQNGDNGLVSGHIVTGWIADVTNKGFDWLYGAIDSSGSKSSVFKFSNIVINNDNVITSNYKIDTEYTLTINEGDFGVYGTTDIVNNPWGSVNNPYVIRTQAQLERLSAIVASGSAVNSIYHATNYPYVKAINKSFANAYFVLDGNISMSEQSVPIGNSSTKFSGTFDGKNHTISNFKTSGQYSGLFGYVDGATIQNLTVNVTNNAGATSAGGLVGVVNGTTTIRNCTVNGTISGTHQVGGFVGFAQGVYQDNTLVLPCNLTIEGCTNNATVTTTSQYSSDNNRTSAGGFVGYVNTGATVTINIDENDQTKKPTNNGEVKAESATANTGVGGFVGYSNGTVNITDATNTANISGSASSRVGGVVGYSATLTMNGATNSGQVSGASQVGGIAGYIANGRIYGTVSNSGAITGTSMVGGIGGRIHTYFASDTNVYGMFKNTESVTGTGDSVGGVFGFSDKELRNASNTAYVKGGCSVGGIVGRCQAPIQNSYNTGKVRATTSQTLSSSEASATPTGSFVGGIVGYTSGGAEISNCYNTGYITASLNDDADNQNTGYFSSADYVGGIVGYAQASVAYCANIGGIIDGNNFLGGIVGSSTSTVAYCYDIGGQRQYRWQSANLGGITGSGGTVTNSWVVNEQEVMARADTQTPNINAKGHKFTTELTLVPAVVSGDAQPYTYNVTANNAWTDILTTDINGFKVTVSVQDGYYLSSTTTENGSTGVLPTIVESNAVANAIGQTRKNVTPLSLAYVYSATTGSNIYVATREIEQNDLSSVIYNGKSQGIAKPTVPSSFAINSFYFTHGNANDVGYESRMDVGTYDIITDISVTIGTTKYVVGRKVHQNTWTINKKTLTITPTWSANSESNSGNHYIYVYNAKQQGVTKFELSGFVDGESIDNLTTTELINNNVDYARTGNIYNLSAGYAVNANNYGVTIKVTSHNYTFETNPTSIETATEQKQYTWQIKKFDLSAQNVWFGGSTDLIVGNQGIANVNVGNQSYADKRFYPLQSAQTGVQKVLVYAQHNYAADKFVLYVKYNNGTVAVLTQGTEYTLSALDAPTVENPTPLNTSVTASGTGNFSGNITKWYTALFSDFGWKDGKTPEDNDWGGSAANPYVISTPEHLLRLSQIVNGGMAWNSIQNTVTAGVCIAPQTTAKATSRDYNDAYFLVTVNIDMSGYISTDGVYNFLPIGHRNEQSQTDMPFSGTFDGNGKKIKFVYNVNRNNFYNNSKAHSDYVGLFGYIAGYKVDAEQKYATIKNLSIESMDGNEVDDKGGIIGKDYVGGIAGYAVDSKLYNVSMMYGGWVRGENYVGGIVGYADNTWLKVGKDYDNAITNANVAGMQYVGGIVGKWIVRSEDQIGGDAAGQAKITLPSGQQIHGVKYVGGIAGWMDTSSCATTISYAPQLNNNGEKVGVYGTEYVGALFGALIGNGYHQNATNDKYTAIVIDKDASDNFKVGNVKVILQNLNDKSASGNAKVVGGLVGYAEGVGICFNTDWTTSNVTLDTGNYTPSFIGGIAGVLGKNATIEAIYQLKDDGTFLSGGSHTITHSFPDEQTFGTAAKPLGSFVGGIVGYVSSKAGTYWDSTTTIFGNGIALVNSANIYAKGYVGGIFGALGDISKSVVEKSFENDTNSILYKVLTTGVNGDGNANTTLGIAPATKSEWVGTAVGKLHNTAGVSATDNYVGGIAGYSGAKVRFVLRNAPQNGEVNLSNLNVYSAGANVAIYGSYAGGIAGYLADNLEHELQYIVVQAKFDSANAKRVGGLVGYMGSGKVERCVVTSPDGTSPNGTISAKTDNYQGSEYVGGLVGETQNAIIRNSVSTGFNLDKTTNTKGGLLGGGTNPTIDSSWTFYIAKKRTNFAKNATPNGAYYAIVSQSPYGKYILVDEGLINATEASYPTFVSLCGFVGLLTNANVEGTLEFAVKVPNKTLNSNYENTQLAFYNASGSDTVTDNIDSFSKFENKNNTLTIALDMASGNSMQICVVGIEFVNVPQKNDTDTDKTTVVEGKYRKPSNSDKYIVHVTTANFNSERQITKIVATVYFECNGNLPVVIGSAYDDKRNIGGYDESFTPGSSATTPYTISTQEEWNDFAFSIYSGANNYSGKYVKLLTDRIVINTGTGGQHAGTKGTHNFGTETTNSGEGAYATDNVGYNFAGSISNSNLGGQSFQGYFDGNGNPIEIKYVGGNYHNVSVFPNATGATFKNLTITGSIVAGDKQSEEIVDTENSGWLTKELYKSYKAASDIAGFVGKPLGKIVFENCTNAADILGYSKIAGFAGYSTSTAPVELTGCINKGKIESLEGSVWTKKVLYGQRLGYPNDYPYGTGGLIAYAENAITIESCLNTGTIIGKTKVGGLVGRVTNTTTINNSANTGYIEATEVNLYVDSAKLSPANAWSRVGGIVGEASQSSTLNMYACYNTGHIRGWSNVAGGLVGMVGTIPNTEKTHSAVADNLCTIAYSYNSGKVEIGSGEKNQGITMVGTSGYNLNGTCGGGLVGVAVKLRIAYSYNTGDIIGYGGVGYSGSWQIRLGGILAEACTKQANCDVRVTNCYSTGRIHIEENTETSDTRYGADIVGYLDEESTLNNGNTPKVNVADCYGVANNIVSYENSNTKYFSGWNNQSGGDVKYVRTGTTLNSLSDLTAIMRSDGSVKPRAFYYANNQNNEVELWNASTSTIGAQNDENYKNGTLGGYVYVYGCLPQLAVFAVDTYNGLSMNSQNFGKDIYGEYKAQKAGEKYSPYVIRDGIDLMGVQTLVNLGYTFEKEYIEFANGSNNITLDKNLSSDVAKAINMPTTNESNSGGQKIKDTDYAYMASSDGTTYNQIGKSYHLFKQGAVCKDDNNSTANKAYQTWVGRTYYYDGAYNYVNDWASNATFKVQNMLSIGRNGNVFKGSISGKQVDNDKPDKPVVNTVINNLRIMTGKTNGGAYAGLFGHIEDAYVGYIEVGGGSNIWSFSYNNSDISVAGGVVAYMTGGSVVEHCVLSGTASVGAFGIDDKTNITTLLKPDFTYAGGIVGLADTKQGDTYNAGIVGTIKDCIIDITTANNTYSGIISGSKSNIGGVLGYVGGDAGASGKSNSVRIEGCEVQKAAIQAASSANTSSQIGGILGFGSEYVAAFITGCSVGNGADTVTIKGEHSLGGIAGGMSNAKGGYIDSCIVGANTTIERINQGGGNISENPKHGTAIGGLVGFTQNSNDDTSPLTTTFSGTSAFNGTITVSVEATNKSQDSDAKISCIGGIVGDMGSGASFASGSDVTVGGTIDIKNSQGDWLAAANVGGVAGRTSNATFIGKFDVSPTMNTLQAENVGGFIGKNIGTVYILADTTDKLENTTVDALNGTNITIGGTIKGTSEVGGFIGVNNSGSTLNIGSNVANAKAYKSGKLEITITASVTGSHDNVGGIVGKNEGVSGQDDYAIVDIVKGTIQQNGAIKGANNVGGIIGLNDGLLTTGGGAADTTIGGVTLSEEQQNKIKNLSINNTGSVTGTGDYVGGVVGKLDSPAEDSGKGAIAGTFTNSGKVVGNSFVGGSLGFVGKNVTITAKNNVATLFVNDGEVNATGYFVGGSIGALVGKIQGENSSVAVKFENKKKVNATGYVGGSIGVLAGSTKFAQFVNSSTQDFTIAACNSVGGSVGYIGMPDALKAVLNDYFQDDTYSDIDTTVQNVHFEANGNLTAEPTDATLDAAKKDANGNDVADNLWGGVGGSIGVLGKRLTKWKDNTYYANGNVIAQNVNNVGGIVGLINANDITIGNLLAYNITVTGAKNVGGIVGATTGAKTVINSAYAIEGTFSATSATKGAGDNVGGIIGLAKDDTDASTSYWVKGYANSDIATYDVKDLSKLGFTTGKATTGWFFLYAKDANDATGANGLGIINTSHSTNSDLQYWKRIADAYTASERQTKIKDETGVEYTLATIPLKSNIVKDKDINGADTKSPQKSTLYATATAAEVTEKGYYMYTATSNNDVKPSVIYDNGVYYISVKTNVINAEDEKVQAQNVAVFYRSVSSSKEALIYNGYLRNAIIGLDGVYLYENPIGDNETPTINGYKGQYIFTATTTIKNADGSTSEVNEAQSDPNTYSSVIKIYYVDDNGTARLVGGNTELAWKITERELTVKFEKVTNRVYGTGADNSTDMTITISNIAPNRGKSVPIKITVAVDKEDIVVYTWNGTSFTGSNVGVKLAYLLEPNGTLSDEDKSSTSENITDENTYQLVARLFFTEAKSYTITVSDGSSGNTKARYVFKVNEGSAATEVSDNFTVIPAELKLVSSYATSSAYDGTYKGKEWLVTGFKYNDGILQFAEFGPSFNIKYKNGDVTTKAMTADNMTTGVDFNGPRVSVAGPSNGNLTISLANAINKGEYYLTFGKIAAGNYTLKIEDYLFSIVEIQIEISCDDNGKSKIYDGNAKDVKFTFKASAPAGVTFDGISEYKTFISKFFKINNQTIETNSLKLVDNKTITLTLQTEKDASTYKFVFGKGEKYDDHIKNCALKPATLPTYTYTITKRSITLSTTPTSTKTYIYNTEHQGLSQVKLNGESGDVGIVSGDTVMVKVSVPGGDPSSKTLSFDNQTLEVTAGISTIDANQYVASFDLDDASSKKNYTLSATNVSWKIDKYKIMVGEFEIGAEKTYNAQAEVPKINVTNSEVSVSGNTFTYGTDTFTLEYSVSYNGKPYAGNKLVNAGTYKINIGTSNGKIIAKHSDGTDASDNYEFGNSATEHPYVINPCPIEIVWNIKSYVYNASNQMLSISGIKIGENDTVVAVFSADKVKGLGNDTLTFNRSGGGTDVGSYTTKVTSHSVSGEPNHGVRPIAGNYKIVSGATSDKFSITPSKLEIFYAGGTTTKVYDAGLGISGTPFVFNTQSQNGGAHGTSDLFDISYVYKDKNVGNDKEVVFTYVLKQNANYEYVGTGTESQNKGQITPAHIKVALNKLRSGKATRTFTNDVWYGGEAGASGNGNSEVYRSGEGFTISGVLSGLLGTDKIKVVAQYREADDLRNGTGESFNLSKYVNDVVKNADGTFDKAENAGTHFKTLVFTMTGDDAKNYTFNVYNKLGTDGKKYSEKDSTAGDTQTITVYDSRDTENKHQNASGAEKIQIEITVKSVRVDYGNAYQSYANADNTYNTNWNPIIATSQDITAADGTIDVVNNWMYEDNDPTKPKREYHGYTTIRGSEKSTVLGATVSKDKGMNFNFRLINQPVLTIAYIVENNGVYEIDTLARLLIASFYYTAHQNPGDQIFMQIVQSGYKWFEVVNGEDYSQVDFAVPEGSPITVDDTIKTWDAYINALNEKGYVVFYNETEKAWGCYVSDSSQSTSLPSSYKLTKDISGKFTADDIKVLDAFFTVTTTDGNGQFTTTKYTWSGEGSDYLKNVLSAAVDKVATINGSLFVSQKAEGAAAITGFDGTFDGNGYVIEYLNIMGYGKDNVGLFDVIGANGIVKNLHLRNVTINGNAKYVGGIAGKVLAAADALTEKSVKNVSFHGSINVTGSTDQSVGGLFGASERGVENAIVLGSITVSNVNAKVGGVVGTATAGLNNVVSMMQITASGGTVGAFTSDNANVGEKCTHMTKAVWKKGTSGTGFVNVKDKNVGYNALMSGSNSLYANGMSDSGTYDVISETFADSGQNVNPRQSKRLRDMVSVYLLMYSLSANGGTYTISSSSWLVGTADGTNAKPIVIANKQNVSLLRELRFAAFVLKANVSIDIASTFSGAFYGSVTSESGKDYKITCNKQMFEEYATTTQAWLKVKP